MAHEACQAKLYIFGNLTNESYHELKKKFLSRTVVLLSTKRGGNRKIAEIECESSTALVKLWLSSDDYGLDNMHSFFSTQFYNTSCKGI